jgi:asparagine synthase (glutamine-hydrolysing)
MCGIAGIYTDRKTAAPDLRKTIETMTALLRHRGPDEEGYYVKDGVALGHRRLSIIDLKTGRQPIFNEDGSKCIIFNGEIYNYREIKADLLRKGHRFSSATDTETILHAYEEWDEECVKKLNGMFAFCIWDRKTETLFLGRDRLGEKPLFFTLGNGTFAFASEMKALLAAGAADRAIDAEGLASFFTFSYIPAPLTIYRSIRKLPPAHVLTYRKGRLRIRQYWDVVFDPDRRKKEQDFINEYMELLRGSVRARLMSEVPLGAFLSGGIDSSAVVALMSEGAREPVNTFTIGFGGDIGGFDDERKYARLIAEKYKTKHNEHEVLPEVGSLIEKIVGSFDEPFADDAAIPSYFVSGLARKHVTVALSGLGGDELFCGYERYLGFQLSHFYAKIPALIRNACIKRFIEALPEAASGNYTVNHMKRFVRSIQPDHAQQYFGFVAKMNAKYRDSLFSEAGRQYAEALGSVRERFTALFASAPAADPLDKVFYCDLKTYLPEDILACTDRLSMRHSLEVRVPFLDHELVEYCATIPPEMKMKWFKKKYLLKKGVSALLPKAVLEHRKQGFVGPMTRWLQTNMKDLTLTNLSRTRLSRHGLFNYETIERILDDHYRGREINDTTIWSLLIFQAWFDLYLP